MAKEKKKKPKSPPPPQITAEEALVDALNADWGGERPGEEPGLTNIMCD